MGEAPNMNVGWQGATPTPGGGLAVAVATADLQSVTLLTTPAHALPPCPSPDDVPALAE